LRAALVRRSVSVAERGACTVTRMTEQLVAPRPGSDGQRPGVFTRLGHGVAHLWTTPAWFAPAAVFALLACALTYVGQNNPTDNVRDPLAPCLFKSTTGLDCPACGGTRMCWSLMHGDLAAAARYHAVAFALTPVALYGLFAWTSARLFGTRIPWVPGPRFWIPAAAAWTLFAVARDLPVAPFSHLLV
jgi:hypothetical protein